MVRLMFAVRWPFEASPTARAGVSPASARRRRETVDGTRGVVTDIEGPIRSGDSVDGTAPAAAVGLLESGDERDRRQKRLRRVVPRHPEHGGFPGWLAVPGTVHGHDRSARPRSGKFAALQEI